MRQAPPSLDAMGSDLAVTIAIGSVALALVALLFWWMGRARVSETISWERKFGLWTPTTRGSEEAWKAGHRAAKPFLTRYSRIIGVSAGLSFLLTFVNSVAAVITYCIGVVFLVLGIVAVRNKADHAARNISAPPA